MSSYLEDYQQFVWGNTSEASKKDAWSQYVTVALGLTGEAGEFADEIKKHLFHGKELNEDNLIKEMGDMVFYLALGCQIFGTSIEEVARINEEKLRARYPNGFSVEDFLKKESAKNG